MIKESLRGTILLPVVFLASCSSFSIYNESECNYTPEHYGQCYADMGYNTQGYESLTKFCAERGKTLSLEKYQKAHADRLKDICSKPDEVFRLSFRKASKMGPQACPESLLQTEELRKAAQDGKTAGQSYSDIVYNENQATEATEKRKEAENNGLGTTLVNSLNTSSDEYEERAKASEQKYEKILATYPKAKGTYLTERLKCTSEGWL